MLLFNSDTQWYAIWHQTENPVICDNAEIGGSSIK